MGDTVYGSGSIQTFTCKSSTLTLTVIEVSLRQGVKKICIALRFGAHLLYEILKIPTT
jgi:hypothetical protein